MDTRRGLDRGFRVVVETLRGMSRRVSTRRENAQVATISAHDGPAMGELGRARRVVVDKQSTTITGGLGERRAGEQGGAEREA